MPELDNSPLTEAYISLRREHNDLRVVFGTDVAPSEFMLLAILRNEMYFLPAFLAHYRRLGVQKFIFLDDHSDDGSSEYLLEQPDTVVVKSAQRYGYRVELPPTIRGPNRSLRIEPLWRSMLYDMFAMDRWALLVDLDEFIHLPQGMTFQDLVAQLDNQGARATWAVMLDVYPRDIAGFTKNEESPQLDTSATWYFDGEQHLRLRVDRRPKRVYPGARARLYSEYGIDKFYPVLGVRKHDRISRLLRNVRLRRKPLRYNDIMKPALLKWRDDSYFRNSHSTNLSASMHYLLPIQHFRFSGSLSQRAQMALRENSHFHNSSDYRLVTELLAAMKERNGTFLYRKSRPLESFEDLAKTRNAVGF